MGKLLGVNLLQRVLVALVGIPFFVWMVRLGGIAFFFLVLLLACIAIYEFCRLARSKAVFVQPFLALFLTLCLQLNFYVAAVDTWELLLGLLLLLFVVELFRNVGSPLLNLGVTLLALLYVNLCFGSLFLLSQFGRDGEELVLLLFVCVWTADISAYFGGNLLGGKLVRRKLFERRSPNKTWEGYLAGLVGSGIAAVICSQQMPLTPQLVYATGLLVGIASPVGDLVESMFKRDAQIKDSSSLIPGHGGVLDRFDTVMFVAPLVYLLSSHF